MLKKLLLIFLFLIFATYPAGAVEEINQDHIKALELDSPTDLFFTGIELKNINIEEDSNVNLTLNKYGETYLLNVSAHRSYLSYCQFDITLTNPNGSIETKHLSNVAPFANDYALHIQSYWWEVNSSLSQALDLKLYTSLLPLKAQLTYMGSPWSNGTYFPSDTPDLGDYTVIPFSHIGIVSDSYFDTTIYACTPEELADQQNNDILASWSNAAGDFFTWSWSNLLTFVEKIPLVGGHISAVLVLTTMTLSSIIFYTKLLFIDYSETTFLTIEFFILSYSFTKKGTFWTQIKRVVDCHVKIIELTIDTAQAAVNLFTSIINAVASIIQALKPI